MANLILTLQPFMNYIGVLLRTSGLSYKLYVGAISTAMIVLVIMVLIVCLVTWRYKDKKIIIIARRMIGQEVKGDDNPPSGPRLRQSHSMSDLTSTTPRPVCEHPRGSCRACGGGGGGGRLRTSVSCDALSTLSHRQIQIELNDSYNIMSDSVNNPTCSELGNQGTKKSVILNDNVSYVPGPPPPPPPPYFDHRSGVNSVHEYEYIDRAQF